MSAPTRIDVDYLVVGAGAMGMAFVDTLLTSTPHATIALVDKYARPGGHWTTAYSFVRLHQPSANYGVNSKHLGQDRIDRVGLNQGLYELASADEICGYYAQVLHDTFLPSGRVQYFPKSEWHGDRRWHSILTGQEWEVGTRTKLVDATYMKAIVPSMRPPPFAVEEGIQVVTPNDMTKLSRPYANYTVVGAGKTGIDACLWLLGMGIHPDHITWIMPRDSWLFDRAMFRDSLLKRDVHDLRRHMKAVLSATSVEDVFHQLVAVGQALRFDENVTPTMFRCATVSKLELEEARRIKDVVRLGRVRSIQAGEIIFERGSRAFATHDTVFIDCTADGLESRPVVPVFTPHKITLQPVRYCQQVFSAAAIAHVEAAYDEDRVKNELCLPVPHPNHPVDLLRVMILSHQNVIRWSREPAMVAWLVNCRLDWNGGLDRVNVEDEDVRSAAGDKLRGQLNRLCTHLQSLLGESRDREDRQVLARL